MHVLHEGDLALQVYLPWSNIVWPAFFKYFLGTTSYNFFWTSSGFFPGAKPVLLLTLNTCVSTAIVGNPKPSFNTTLAVFLPTPGKACKSSKRYYEVNWWLWT